MAINPLLGIGASGLTAAQACISTTGNNIANVNTPGYSRQGVNLVDSLYIDGRPGQMGTGVTATDVFRSFDLFIEKQYNTKATTTVRYGTLWSNLKSVESMYNESNTPGINSGLARFFDDWQQVANNATDLSARQVLISDAETLAILINQRDQDLKKLEKEINNLISQSVDDVNTLTKRIADLNSQIKVHSIEGVNNPNGLMDERDRLVRQLAEKLDIETSVNLDGTYTVRTTHGQPLVDSNEVYEIKMEGPQAYQTLVRTSTFAGEIQFSGSDSYEYTVEIVQGGDVGGATAAQFRVSIDGGQTWIKDEAGNDMLYEARDLDNKVAVGDLDISFTAGEQLTTGDRFTIVPKDGIYWYKNTSTKENITTQIYPNGTDNQARITGGEIAGYLELRDRCIGEYRQQLDSLAKTLAWEVNRMHSQGVGLSKITDAMGTYSVDHIDMALADLSSGLEYGSYLTAGNIMTYIYDAATNEQVAGANGPLDFDSATAGVQNFDPTVHTLEDVRDAFNNTYGTYLTAEILDNKLHIKANDGYSIGFETDTTGLLAALGINTFFQGSSASDIAVNQYLASDPSKVCAAAINGAFEGNEGDNITANKIAQLLTQPVTIQGRFGATVTQSLSGYYGASVTLVGTDTSNALFNYQYNFALATDLNNRQQAVAGVNLDEELTSLIKFQHAFTAASKLVTTADQMLQTILAMKQ